MTSRGDPYSALGLAPGASLTDVKRAYRLLVKRNHPDAGEGSLERFLEIQAAYETLLRGGPAVGAGPGSDGRGPAGQGPSGPGATRPPGRRPAPPGQRGSRASTGSAPAGPEHAGARPGRGSGERSPGERGRRARDPRKATLGSTTYDGAGEATEPAWDGADWYGPASGTYWTLNPKEYADPRKHGPEYLARARAARSRGPRGRPPRDDAASTGSQDGDPVPPAAAEADRPAPPTSKGPPDAPPAPGARPAPDVPPAASAPGVPPAPPVTVDGGAARTAPVAGRPGLRRRLERLGDAARRRLAPRSRRSSR
ncbi:MAG: DnaJ domain-containing protein [Candidatus Limnocylindrales bacterium]|nr:DnaJ domain-containing protein [Candidatus Limnocylindrales bacterium]